MRNLVLMALLAVGCNSAGLPMPECGGDGERCCASTEAEALARPAPPKGDRGLGTCGDGFACTYVNCPPRSTCDDGSYNGEVSVVYINYCVPLQ